MSGGEKATQIGAAVQELQDAKVEVAHIEQKVAALAAIYGECATALKERPPFEILGIEHGKLKFKRSFTPVDLSRLLDEAGLYALIEERSKARLRQEKAAAAVRALGITTVE